MAIIGILKALKGILRRYEMKRYVLAGVLMALLFPTVVLAQKGEQPKRRPGKKVDQQMRLHRQRVAEAGFGRKMKTPEMKRRRFGFENRRRFQEGAGKHFKHHRCWVMKKLFVIVALVVHILLGVWVYQDIRRRQCGSGIWIVIVLLTGLLGVLPYAIVRLGDTSQAKA